MRTYEGTWFYVSLDTRGAKPTAVRLVGNVQTPGGLALLAEAINKQLFNSSRLLLVPSEPQVEPISVEPETFLPVRTFNGSHLEAGQSVSAGTVQAAQVLDIAGITPSRQVAESWSRK